MTKQKHKFKYICFLLLFFLCSIKGMAANYYWVGGSGNWSDIGHWRTTSGGSGIPSVVPGPTDDVFFDANSGFTTASKTVSVNVAANCHNITFSGSGTAPILAGSGIELNIYGSSEWQLGMIVNVSSVYYRNTNTPKTIKSNGVSFRGGVNLEEETSVSLSDDFSAGTLNHNAGLWNTNGYKVTLESYKGDQGSKPRTLTMGSSDFYLTFQSFSASSSLLTLNSGTSHIHFLGQSSTLIPYAGQVYYNVSFEYTGTSPARFGSNQTAKVYYNRVEFKGNGSFIKDNQIRELVLTEGKTYSLDTSATQTITSSFTASTSGCGDWITVNSLAPGTQAKIVAASNVSIDVSRVILKDIHASGGAVFNAANSTDNGNNTGWTFPASAAQNLYWVGGGGNWNDSNHWSSASGGPGGSCVPGPADDVFFDGNSGFTTTSKTITLTSTSYGNNITFSGNAVAPSLSGSGTELNILGSSEWQSGMTVNIRYIYYRNNNKIRSIKSNGVSSGSEVIFEEENTINLLDDFSAGTLNHNAGLWNTNGYKVTLESYEGDKGSKPRTLTMGSSDFYLTFQSFSASSSLLTLNSGTSHLHFLGQSSILTPYAGQVYYNVSFEYTGTPPARFGYNQTAKVYYNRVEFKGNGEIKGNNQIKELVLTEGKTYTFASSSTQTITSLFSAHSQGCGDWITINASAAGTQAKLVAAAGVSIDVSRALIKDIHASGGATFSAANSTDNGNNTGWTFPASAAQNLYWVGGGGNWNDSNHWSSASGGPGGSCVPGPADDVFFDVNSGFTDSAKLIALSSGSYCHNITFSGSAVPPTLYASGTDLNIYGSSEWQTGMIVAGSSVYYRNSNTPKTIKSNGVSFRGVNLEEETSVSLSDDFSAGTLNHNAGLWNTNGYKVTLESYKGDQGSKPRTLTMGSSDFYLTFQSFSASSSLLTLNSGTSHIHVLGQSSTLIPYAGQVYYNVSFEYTGTAPAKFGYNQTAKVYYNRVEFKGNGEIKGDNQIKELILTAGKTYILESGKTQTVTDKLYASGNSCFILFLKSSFSGTKANLDLKAGPANFDFANVRDINAIGESFNFGSKSTDAGNNSNITFETYDPSAFSGFAGQNWSVSRFKDNDPSTYTLSTAGFYGNPYTTYKWTKVNDPAHTGTIATGMTLDMRPFGYGTYHVKVEYSAPGSADYCVVEESIMVKSFVPSMMNPGLPVRNY